MKALKRSRERLPVLACWPQLSVEHENTWHMLELQLKKDGGLDWFLRLDDVSRGGFGPIVYHDYDSAIAEAKATNVKLAESIGFIGISESERKSIQLKVEKAITAEARLMSEERLMLSEAVRRNQGAPRPRIDDLKVPEQDGRLLESLYSVLQVYPYVRLVKLPGHDVVLFRNSEFDWTTKFWLNRKLAIYCYREKIAGGFGLSGTEHWGKTKAAIRDALMPRANKLLHLASVKMMLADALRHGRRVLIVGGFVFWYEEDGGIGWVVKQLGGGGDSAVGQALWREGSILSKNHGRIVVLPYVKENGEKVQGHTKNAPHDGKAIPRHPDHYVELPFDVLDGDLMYGLLGEINYE